ncbi:hypothetical protein FQN54_001948 [Arachnomyces sp. PD_36]|nr:hypothetical protein FQN54_001948 [Arachnomyces sp. PD_36]
MDPPTNPNPDDDLAPSSFPRSPSQFDTDPRISFSKLDDKYILETEDGAEFEYDAALKRWVASLDDALLEQQREAYKVQGVDENEPAVQQKKKKRKQYTNGEEDTGNAPKAKKARVNTAVYVTSIPLDASPDEINDVFSKCGVISEEIDRGRPRIKMYTDDEGNFKGDALVVYFRKESVDLAIQMLDETDFRFGEMGPAGKMKVQAADFSFKSQQEAPAKSNNRDKKKIMRKTQKLNKWVVLSRYFWGNANGCGDCSKLTDWDDDEPSAPDTSRWGKVVILKHMFTLQELEEDPAAILDIKEDIRDECSKLGEVTNVILFDKEEDGVASVRFSDPETAVACVQMMDGRFFAGTRVEAYVADGSEKFKKTNEKRAALLSSVAEGEADEESERLDKFGSWLENEAESGEGAKTASG